MSAPPVQAPRRNAVVHLLVVDDSISVQEAVRAAFQDLEHVRVSACGDVPAAEGILAAQAIDIVLCDVVLPGPSGYDLCTRLKSRNTHTPVLLLSSAFEPFSEERARSAAADGVIGKPFTVAEIRAGVEGALAGKKRQEGRRAPAEPQAAVLTPSGEAWAPDTGEIEAADVVGTAINAEQVAQLLLEPLVKRLLEPVALKLVESLEMEPLSGSLRRLFSETAERLVRRRIEEIEAVASTADGSDGE